MITNLQEYQELKAIAQMHSVVREERHRIVNAYKQHIRNSYVCDRCPDQMWMALTALKELYARIEQEWEEKLREEEVKRMVEEYKRGEEETKKAVEDYKKGEGDQSTE